MSAYHSTKSDVYHIYKNCTVGNNIEKENLRSGTGGKTLCKVCKKKKNRDAERN